MIEKGISQSNKKSHTTTLEHEMHLQVKITWWAIRVIV